MTPLSAGRLDGPSQGATLVAPRPRPRRQAGTSKLAPYRKRRFPRHRPPSSILRHLRSGHLSHLPLGSSAGADRCPQATVQGLPRKFSRKSVTERGFPGTYGQTTMKTTELMALIDTTSDADLVAACLAGNRDAFGRIVERYQRLLCSLAYSAIGNVTESEDLAQEAFVTAWRRLGTLREPEKLRAWLCTILRHQVGRARRTDCKEPVRGAESLEAATEIHGADAATPDTAMRSEEQAILWHALRELPEAYREPLVLYYREHRSVEHVAGDLDLTEDTVKQRLSRGRKLLKEQALAFVEGALERSTPGRLFTVGVLAALPAMAPTAKAAGLATGATVAAKSGRLAGSSANLNAPI